MRRPAGVTIVAVFLILGAVAALFSLVSLFALGHHPHPPADQVAAMAQRESPIPASVNLALGFGSSLLNGLAGILLLRRRERGRTLYAVAGGVGLLVALATTRLHVFVILPLAIYAVFMLLLFRPVATRWFRHGRA